MVAEAKYGADYASQLARLTQEMAARVPYDLDRFRQYILTLVTKSGDSNYGYHAGEYNELLEIFQKLPTSLSISESYQLDLAILGMMNAMVNSESFTQEIRSQVHNDLEALQDFHEQLVVPPIS